MLAIAADCISREAVVGLLVVVYLVGLIVGAGGVLMLADLWRPRRPWSPR